MYIGRIMHTELVTVTPETTLVKAKEIIEAHSVDHLLVVDTHEKLVGVISDRDLKQNWASPATSLSTHELNYLLQKVLVAMIMIKTVVTVSPDTTIERAAYIMQTNNINSLPVVDKDELVGIITSTDVMEVLLQAIGMSDDSVRLSLFVKDSMGKLADVTAILKEENINLQSFFCWPTKKHPGVIQMVIRVLPQDGPKAIEALNKRDFKVLAGYEKDLTPYLP